MREVGSAKNRVLTIFIKLNLTSCYCHNIIGGLLAEARDCVDKTTHKL